MLDNDLLTINFLFPHAIEMINFCGVHDSNLRYIERLASIKIFVQSDGSLMLKGGKSDVLFAKQILDQMLKLCQTMITQNDLTILSQNIKKNPHYSSKNNKGLQVSKNHFVKAYTKNQEKYIEKISMYDITFGIGPAGTGKTYIAVAVGLRELKLGNVKKLILTRPIVETDENLGFLPGTLEEKIDPYIRPLYDALHSMLSLAEYEHMVQNNQLELAPLAYMRGRTLADAFVILDEAQNATLNQMKMFLTRLGKNSKMVITGDLSQIDLQKHSSGLIEALNKLKHIDDIGVHYFEAMDSVRHGLVQKIIEAYE